MTARERTISILVRIVGQPYRFTKTELAQLYGKSKDSIKDDINAIKNAGLEVDYDYLFRLAILPSKEFKELQHLQALSNEDKAQIKRALDYLSNTNKHYLSKKIDSLLDFQQLGIRALRKPALDRLDQLEKAKREERVVILKNYHSRSNQIRDRMVEAFHIDTEAETIQAFDIEKMECRHFRFSRIERVEITDQAWSYSGRYRQKITDVFRIANNDQVNVHLKLNVSAYNSLVEDFPLARTYIELGSELNTFDFQCKVNKNFIGLINFIMANAKDVSILSPKILAEKVVEEAKEIINKVKK